MKKLTRREMIRLMGINAAGIGLAACGAATPTAAPQATDTTAPQATSASAQATDTPAPTTAPAQGAPVKITMVELSFTPKFRHEKAPK